MINPSNEEIRKRIKSLEEEIHNYETYLLSESCSRCADAYAKIEQYKTEIGELIQLYHND
jgi:DNA mismatch repair ATPase MutS